MEATFDQTPEISGGADVSDLAQEIESFYGDHPEERENQIPDSVAKAVAEGKPFAAAMEEHLRGRAEEQSRRVRAENAILRQNAESARRAPVRGTAGSGVETNATSDFLRGFNSKDW